MVDPIRKLTNILTLEAEECEDRAVFGGLARYADTWLRETADLYASDTGAGEAWRQDVAGRLRVYSRLPDQAARRKAVTALLELLRQGPSVDKSRPSVTSTSAPVSLSAANKNERGRAHTGLDSPVTVLRGVGKRQAQ